jgi:choline-glycine betaine transporter
VAGRGTRSLSDSRERLWRAGTISAVEVSQESMLFALLDQFPLAEINAVIVMVLIVLWFVSGARTPPRS